jgi:hypothetical protein
MLKVVEIIEAGEKLKFLCPVRESALPYCDYVRFVQHEGVWGIAMRVL